MGIKAKEVKDRVCLECGKTLQTDAKGIKKHAKECKNGRS